MKSKVIQWLVFWIGFTACAFTFAGEKDPIPVSPHASKEAEALLRFLTDISGKYTLTGQHNYPNTKDRNSRFAAQYSGKMPAVFSQDWGHAKDGDSDSYLARPDIVNTCIEQHRKGALITICWHAVPPTAEEPITFRPLPGSDPDSLKSVQGQLLDRQFKDMLTPGTALYKQWCKQVDSIAVYLKQLQEAHVPVLWRPYHEMNGKWFWWGGRHEPGGTVSLYRQLFNRLVYYHHLNNLIWVWSVDRAHNPDMFYSRFFPGIDYLDVVALDVYGRDFNQTYYDSLAALSDGKPMVLAEVGNPPTLDAFETQPRWAYWVIWAGMVRNTLKKEYDAFYHAPRILTLDDSAFWKITRSYRKACGLDPLPIESERSIPNFSGEWLINEDKSDFENRGASNQPYRLIIRQTKDSISIRSVEISEWGENRVEENVFSLEGKVLHSVYRKSPRETFVSWSESGETLEIYSKITFSSGNQTFEAKGTDRFTLNPYGSELILERDFQSFWGKQHVVMVFEKLH